ncbi:DNA repair protein RecN [Nesterenkonia sp. E16_7]|uniref:DNA repair protein RecN n=1 Tax=unclassified Nesterenkonia TaxID=2629769 RepID=UPI001A91DC58|nr:MULTISPECIES: DNA repair protein RecN [unclassified Nesterenkonia]MBO0595232.1 DNA repair protein RecN [Nesterenkonia sp. E16_10]MBO0598887.1 DNA repair protein RecN [Nesterenkonia sp. E16_7]
MIDYVTIRDLGVIEHAELPLDAGLNVVTGETGAGKTMVVTALGLLLGARAEAAAIRSGAPQAVVDAGITVPATHRCVGLAREAGAWLETPEATAHAEQAADGAGTARAAGTVGDTDPADAADQTPADQSDAVDPTLADQPGEVEILLGRTLSAKGRSRASVSGRNVPIALLGEIGSSLVTVHGQSDQLRLRSAAAQRRALDRYAGPEFAARLAEYKQSFTGYQVKVAELEEITTNERERRREAEQLQLALEQIDAVEPLPGEDHELKTESLKLENVEGLREAARSAQLALSGPDAAEALDDVPHAVALVESAATSLAAVRDQDQELGEIAEQISSVSSLLNDAASELGIYAAHLDESGPERLAAVHQRRADLERLIRLYGPDIDAVLLWAQEARARLHNLQSDSDRIEELSAELEELQGRLWTEAGELRRRRTEAGERLGAAVGEELAALAMPRARMVLEVTETAELGPEGADTVAMLLAPHPGADPLPLGKGASGGELSRVMLALEVVLAEGSETETFIFDEVDAGVGGKAAVQIGRRLAMLAKHRQVIVVTHLPQVAAYAQNHIRVFKSSVRDDSASGGFTASDVTALDEEQRVSELARMLAGQEDSESARAHARELISAAAAP